MNAFTSTSACGTHNCIRLTCSALLFICIGYIKACVCVCVVRCSYSNRLYMRGIDGASSLSNVYNRVFK